jgi:hypothetical protein
MALWSVPGLIELAIVCAAATGLPPVTTRPHSAATSAASRKLVERADAAARDDKADEAIALLRQAVAAEPANHDARTALVGALLERHPDEALAILTELRDARCRACVRAVTAFVEPPNGSTDDAAVRAKLEALANGAHGPPTRVTAAADAVWKAFERQEWKLLAPYVGDKVRIKTTNMATDTAETRSVALPPARLRAWFKTRTGLDLHRDESWFCTDRCCEYWSWNGSRNDVTEYLERMCFDTTSGRPLLTLLEWESG